MRIPKALATIHASIVIACTVASAAEVQRPVAKLQMVLGVTPSGEATELWTAMVRKLRNRDVAVPTEPATAEERAWESSIVARSSLWESEAAALADIFTPVTPPAVVRIVIGRGGGEDAFTHDSATIGFDVRRLHSLYGDATLPDNSARIDRFFRHEYTHLLQKAWLVAHPYPADTPLRAALLGMWTEGLGNYYSLSSRWRTDDGVVSDVGRKKLDELAPRFVARVAALACARLESTETLTTDLSMGPFDQKWGALPVALWLAQDEHRSKHALREFVAAGPDGIWVLAERYLPTSLRDVFHESRMTARLCDHRDAVTRR